MRQRFMVSKTTGACAREVASAVGALEGALPPNVSNLAVQGNLFSRRGPKCTRGVPALVFHGEKCGWQGCCQVPRRRRRRAAAAACVKVYLPGAAGGG